jgi:hypothetical protein
MMETRAMKKDIGRKYYVVQRPMDRHPRVVGARGKTPANDPQRKSPIFAFKRAAHLHRYLEAVAVDEQDTAILRVLTRWAGYPAWLDAIVSRKSAMVDAALRVRERLDGPIPSTARAFARKEEIAAMVRSIANALTLA